MSQHSLEQQNPLRIIAASLRSTHNLHMGEGKALHLRPVNQIHKTCLHVAINDLGGNFYQEIERDLNRAAAEFGLILHYGLIAGEFNLFEPETDEFVK